MYRSSTDGNWVISDSSGVDSNGAGMWRVKTQELFVEELTEVVCPYCRTIGESKFHPGVCGNCGAPLYRGTK